MSRKSKPSKSTAHKSQKAQAKNRAAMKERLQKRQNRRESFYDFLDEAYGLYDDGHFEEVRALLLQKFDENPRAESDESLELLGNTAIQLDDLPTTATVFRKLTARMPGEIHYQMNYAASLSNLALPQMAKAAFEKLQQNWPDDPLAAGAADTMQQLEARVELAYAKFPWTKEERPALALLHEEMMFGITTNDFAHVIRNGEKLLARSPDFPPVYNNLAIGYREGGKATEAIRTCETLLARDPENPHTIVILGDCLYAQGRRSDARAAWSRMHAIAPEKFSRSDWVTRKIEALVRLGEYAAALAAFEAGEDRKLFHPKDPQTAVDLHLAAVAAARLGQHRTASQYWTRSLRINPNLEVAADNRDDHEQPEGERSGAWSENRNLWIPDSFEELVHSKVDEETFAQRLRELTADLAARLPELPDLIADALTAGSPRSRDLAILLCQGQVPALQERLRDFALSPYGRDKDRTSLLPWLQEQGLIRDKLVTVWIKGKPTELKLLTAKINFEGENDFPPSIEKLQSKGYYAIHDGRFAEAERLYRQCLEQYGDHPTLLFNLARAIEYQKNRTAEASAIIDDVIARWPDYFFGKLEQAKRAIEARQYEQGRQLLLPLGELDEYHISEINALHFTWAELEIRAGQLEAARKWVDQVRQLDPENPNLELFDRRLSPAGISALLKRFWK